MLWYNQLQIFFIRQQFISLATDSLQNINSIGFINGVNRHEVTQFCRQFFRIKLFFCNGIKAIEQILTFFPCLISDCIPKHLIYVLSQLCRKESNNRTGNFGILQSLAFGYVRSPN